MTKEEMIKRVEGIIESRFDSKVYDFDIVNPEIDWRDVKDIATAIVESIGICEKEVYNILTDVGFKWKEDAMKFRKQSENIWIDEAKAIASSPNILTIKEVEK